MDKFTESEYFGNRQISFDFEGKKAIIVFPEDDVRTDKWLLKTEYFDAFPEAELELVKQGYHIGFLENENGWGMDPDQNRKARFAEHLHKEYGLNEKCALVGMSCGGCHGINFASRYPEKVACMYLDAPVCNYLSCPMGMGDSTYIDSRQSFVNETGMNLSKLISYREQPFDRADILTEHRIPLIITYGDADMTVPYYENGLLIEDYYKAHGCSDIFKSICKHGAAHHPHGLEDNTPIVEFIKKYY